MTGDGLALPLMGADGEQNGAPVIREASPRTRGYGGPSEEGPHLGLQVGGAAQPSCLPHLLGAGVRVGAGVRFQSGLDNWCDPVW